MPRLLLPLTLAALAAIGCTSRPRAPALVPESIYQNEQEGLRFEAPVDWIVHAKTTLPSGEPVPIERMLVGYKRLRTPNPASFEVGRWDAPQDTNLVDHFTAKRLGPQAWRQIGGVESLTVGGLPAQRLQFQQRARNLDIRKEVTAVHHNGKFYFFSLIAPPDDLTARNEARRAIASVTWKSD